MTLQCYEKQWSRVEHHNIVMLHHVLHFGHTFCLLSYLPVVKRPLLISFVHWLQRNVFLLTYLNHNKRQCHESCSVLLPDTSEHEGSPLYLDISPLGSSWWSRLWAGWEQWEPRHTWSRWTSPEWWCPPGPEHKLRHTNKIHIIKTSIQHFSVFI